MTVSYKPFSHRERNPAGPSQDGQNQCLAVAPVLGFSLGESRRNNLKLYVAFEKLLQISFNKSTVVK